ncbi:thiosulfate/3-mercaptopyruvate sulfurtransferase [Leifsonia sp. EB41]|uniref:sulfurtransferase n=1 Tax=Leifsonia sp. EB41 TaxID=3156260 RepID=UPI00351781D4
MSSTTTRADARDLRVTDAPLVGPDWLESHLADPGVRVVEVDVNATAYTSGHLPGAVLWNPYADLKGPDYRPVADDAIRALFERSGITPDATVVFYGYAPSLGFWLMKLYRHADVRILDTSRAVWQEAGLPWTTETPDVAPSGYPLPAPDDTIRATAADVRAAIGRPGTTIVDARSASEYTGERFWPSGTPEPGGRAGRIPSAVNVDAAGVFDERGRFRDRDTLAGMFAAIDPGTDVITYCTIGNRGSADWFALRYLIGHANARVYDGSWAEWGHDPDTPIA